MDEASIIAYIRDTYRDADVFTAGSGTFFSCDPEKHWPNFATLVVGDEYDSASLLDEAHERVARGRRKKTGATIESR